MCDSRSFSHNQSLCHELVPGVYRPHFLAHKQKRPIRSGYHCRPRERQLKPVICLFFAGHQFKPDCWSSCHEFGHDGYRPQLGRTQQFQRDCAQSLVPRSTVSRLTFLNPLFHARQSLRRAPRTRLSSTIVGTHTAAMNSLGGAYSPPFCAPCWRCEEMTAGLDHRGMAYASAHVQLATDCWAFFCFGLQPNLYLNCALVPVFFLFLLLSRRLLSLVCRCPLCFISDAALLFARHPTRAYTI